MMNALLGIKRNMVSTYDTRGRRVGATVIEVEPNLITQIKTEDGKDGYNAIQLGLGNKKTSKKPQAGHLKKAGIEKNVKVLREIRVLDTAEAEAGQEISVGKVFKVGDLAQVTGISKGRGFQGGVKRYGFHGGPKTHGQSDRHRAPGSIGSGTTPGRVFKGKRMAGHHGADQFTYTGLEVVGVDRINHLLTIKGGVPGVVGGLVVLENVGHVKGHTPPAEEEETVDDAAEPQEETVAGVEVAEPETRVGEAPDGNSETEAQESEVSSEETKE